MANAIPHPLSYATRDIPTHRRRTVLSTMLRWLMSVGVALGFVVRQLIVAAAVLLILLGQVLRFALQVTAALLLLLAGIRWTDLRRRMMNGARLVDRWTLRIVGALSRNPLFRPAVR
jgi:hypothetical protein